ncbi:hypothetical protein HXX76_011764 [Chlamydomonas incerta]|uniref:Uncharacterized protein n=1 Tax=Chlamydomonas incerta TaxID=51695 RepID=A0A835VV11_CHLIN|nr:hypothetical protein HXX76_011764 [Chlamydomonas incerta]|eukprot:KAG2426539.1 hypothetical protein HXX76_011764 [Chlamydomonas incerta]
MNATDLFKGICATYKITADHLWREMRRLCPQLEHDAVLVEFKPRLSTNLIRERHHTTAVWLRKAALRGKAMPANWPAIPHAGAADAPAPSNPPPPPLIPCSAADLNEAYIKRIIWIDAKKFIVRPKAFGRYGIVGLAQSNVIFDSRVKGRPWGVIHYYSAVNYQYGGILIKLVTGTKGVGYTAPKVYKTKTGRLAGGPTEEEFEVFVSEVLKDPDMHCIIEQSHAHLMDHMTKFINGRLHVQNDTLGAYTAELENALKERVTPQYVQRMTHRLYTKVLPEILRLGGLIPSKVYR